MFNNFLEEQVLFSQLLAQLLFDVESVPVVVFCILEAQKVIPVISELTERNEE